MAFQTTQTVVVIASTMRSGSTLLKALLAVAPDVSDLPETDFQGKGTAFFEALSGRCPEPIVVLKRPCWFHEVRRYPRLPEVQGTRAILLFRDPYPTVVSLRKMLVKRFHVRLGFLLNGYLLERYWVPVTRRLLETRSLPPPDSRCMAVRYEQLTEAPVEQTRALFEFVGSQQTDGIDSYNAPERYQWRWGRDDGGAKIRSLKVLPSPPRNRDERLERRIMASSAVQGLMQRVRDLRGTGMAPASREG